jgi:hypothetical protein
MRFGRMTALFYELVRIAPKGGFRAMRPGPNHRRNQEKNHCNSASPNLALLLFEVRQGPATAIYRSHLA